MNGAVQYSTVACAMHRILIVGVMFSVVKLVGMMRFRFGFAAELCGSYPMAAGVFWPVFFIVAAAKGRAGNLTVVSGVLAFSSILAAAIASID